MAGVTLREVVKTEAENLDAWVDLGNCYATKGFYAESEKALLRALEIDGADLMANYHMAALRAAQGDAELLGAAWPRRGCPGRRETR